MNTILIHTFYSKKMQEIPSGSLFWLGKLTPLILDLVETVRSNAKFTQLLNCTTFCCYHTFLQTAIEGELNGLMGLNYK